MSEEKDKLVGFTAMTSESLHNYVVADIITKGDNSVYSVISKRNHIDLFTITGIDRFKETFESVGNAAVVEQFANSCLSNLYLGEDELRVIKAYVKLALSIIKANDIDAKEAIFTENDVGKEVYELNKEQLTSFMYYLTIFTARHIILVNHKEIERGVRQK